ncbi:zf-PARP multi-domain protein [Pyrenophora teres f. maculata]|nr:zf-PARP multi-domain protein [Pyrenophora teres f. maculata]
MFERAFCPVELSLTAFEISPLRLGTLCDFHAPSHSISPFAHTLSFHPNLNKMGEEGPKWRLEHSPNGFAVYQQAACKRARAMIGKGELACATKHQIAGLVETTDNDPTKAPGYQRLSQESQQQVRLAFESGTPTDIEFKGVREDLTGSAQRYAKEYRNAIGYKVDVAVCAAACRGGECLAKGIKVLRNELRLGILVLFDGEYSTMVYKHWLQDVVMKTIETGKVVEPPESKNETPVKPKKARTKTTKAKDANKGQIEEPGVKVKAEDIEMGDAPISTVQAKPKKSRVKKRTIDDVEANGQPEAKPLEKMSQAKKRGVNEVNGSNEPELKLVPKKTRTKKRAVKKVENNSESEAEPEYVPKKSRSLLVQPRLPSQSIQERCMKLEGRKYHVEMDMEMTARE